jgi:hypothetical protein
MNTNEKETARSGSRDDQYQARKFVTVNGEKPKTQGQKLRSKVPKYNQVASKFLDTTGDSTERAQSHLKTSQPAGILSSDRRSVFSNAVFGSAQPLTTANKNQTIIEFQKLPSTTKNSNVGTEEPSLENEAPLNGWVGGNQNAFSGFPAPLTANVRKRTYTRAEKRRSVMPPRPPQLGGLDQPELSEAESMLKVKYITNSLQTGGPREVKHIIDDHRKYLKSLARFRDPAPNTQQTSRPSAPAMDHHP